MIHFCLALAARVWLTRAVVCHVRRAVLDPLLAAGPLCVHTVQRGLTPVGRGLHCAAHVLLDLSVDPMLQCVVCAELDLSAGPTLQCAVSARQAPSPTPPTLQHAANARQAPSAHPTAQNAASVRWVTTVGWALGRASPVLWACSPTCRRQQHACHARQGTTSHIPPSQCVGNAMQGRTSPCLPSPCACSAWRAPTPPQLVKHSVSRARGAGPTRSCSPPARRAARMIIPPARAWRATTC